MPSQVFYHCLLCCFLDSLLGSRCPGDPWVPLGTPQLPLVEIHCSTLICWTGTNPMGCGKAGTSIRQCGKAGWHTSDFISTFPGVNCHLPALNIPPTGPPFPSPPHHPFSLLNTYSSCQLTSTRGARWAPSTRPIPLTIRSNVLIAHNSSSYATMICWTHVLTT